MNVVLYLYNGCYDTELAPLAHVFREASLSTAACQEDPIVLGDSRKMVVDRRVESLDPSRIDLLVLPGGRLQIEPAALDLIRACAGRGAWIGGICAGVDLMAHAGILAGRRYTSYYEPGTTYDHLPADGQLTYRNLEVDGRLVTASYHAYLEFALVLALRTGVMDSSKIDDFTQWFKRPLQMEHLS